MENQNGKINEAKYIELLKQGFPLRAIKAYKEDTGCGLAEAKEYIDNLPKRSDVQEELRKAREERRAAGEDNGSGCLPIIAILLVILAVVYFFL